MNTRSCRLLFVSGVLLALLAMLVPVSCRAHGDSGSGVIRFGVFPFQSPKIIIEMYAPLVSFLEEKLGKKIQLLSAPDAASFLIRAKEGEYDLMLSVPVLLYKLPPAGYRVIARGEPSFYGGVIVRSDSAITTIDQLKGKKIGAVGEHSYGGYLFLLPLLAARGIDPQKDVTFQFLDKVSIIVYGVSNRKFDAGVLRVGALEHPSFAGIREQVRVIALSPEIPEFPFIVKNSLDASTVTAIQEALVSLSPDRPDNLAILNGMQVKKMVAATDADYDQFHEQVKDSEYLRHP